MKETNFSILIGDDSLSLGFTYANRMEQLGFKCIKVERNISKIYDAILDYRPNIIILDTALPSEKLISLVDRVNDIENYNTKFILVEHYRRTEENETLVLEEKVDYYVRFPIDTVVFLEKLERYSNDLISQAKKQEAMHAAVDLTNVQDDLEVAVTEVIMLIGIPAHVKGYQYIRCAILNCIEDNSMLNSVTKVLYPTVAKAFDTSASRVERAIRHAIEIAWDRGDIETLNSYFGYTINNQRGKPTNSEFIAMVSDKLRLKYKHLLAKNS